MKRRLAAALFVSVVSLGATRAARADDVENRLSAYEVEARMLATDLPRPDQPLAPSGEALLDGEVAYQLGDFDTAALELFSLATTLQGPDKDAATYYLAESLYQKGDRGAARTYFTSLVGDNNTASKYYQPALVRLVEISIAQNDDNGIEPVLGAINNLPSASRSAEVPYVLGKYAFAHGKYDEALADFAAVPKGSPYELQSLYYTATTNVANKDYAKATELFTDLIARIPQSANDRRVIELAQLALGRLYYQQDQPSKAIDAYLLIDRHSDLFSDALYEVAWVYVKDKQYDKALRALELLEQSDPQSDKTPTVRILEGNLRIRKAQMIRQAQVNGTINPADHADTATEYDKAAALFSQTHDQYMPSYVAVSQMVDGNLDPAQFLDQIANRQGHVFQSTAPIPEAAAQWLRDEPEVQRFVGVEGDLGEVQTNLVETAAMIARLDAVISAGDRTVLYPALAARRQRIAAIQDALIGIRNEVADRELRLVDSNGELAQLTANRKQLAQQFAALGDPEQAYADRVAATDQAYDKLEDDTGEIAQSIDSAQAMAVALRKYASEANPPLAADQKAQLEQQLDDAAKEAQSIEDELAGVHRGIVLGKDLSGVGDESIAQARDLRAKLRAAQDAENRVLAGFASASRDARQSQALAALADRAARLSGSLDQTDQQIDQIASAGLANAKTTLAQAKADLATYQAELAADEADAHELGSTVVGASFKDVKAKLGDIIIRTDVGGVDVAWSRKEDVDDDLKRLNLARARELKQLHDEFKDILDETAPAPSAPTPAPSVLPPASSEGSSSPDKGGGSSRVSPGSGVAQSPTQPTVKPEETAGHGKGGSK